MCTHSECILAWPFPSWWRWRTAPPPNRWCYQLISKKKQHEDNGCKHCCQEPVLTSWFLAGRQACMPKYLAKYNKLLHLKDLVQNLWKEWAVECVNYSLSADKLIMKEKDSLVNGLQFSHINNGVTMVPIEDDLGFKNVGISRTLNKWLVSKLCHAIHISTSLARCWSYIRAYTLSFMCLTSWRLQTGHMTSQIGITENLIEIIWNKHIFFKFSFL